MANATKKPAGKKTVCSLPKQQFHDAAKDLTITIMGVDYIARKKVFSTGNIGWYLSAKTDGTVAGHEVTIQMGLCFTIVGSADAPDA